jgi:hypothetical protein
MPNSPEGDAFIIGVSGKSTDNELKETTRNFAANVQKSMKDSRKTGFLTNKKAKNKDDFLNAIYIRIGIDFNKKTDQMNYKQTGPKNCVINQSSWTGKLIDHSEVAEVGQPGKDTWEGWTEYGKPLKYFDEKKVEEQGEKSKEFYVRLHKRLKTMKMAKTRPYSGMAIFVTRKGPKSIKILNFLQKTKLDYYIVKQKRDQTLMMVVKTKSNYKKVIQEVWKEATKTKDLRIGIGLGKFQEILIKQDKKSCHGSDYYGDAVNLAARMGYLEGKQIAITAMNKSWEKKLKDSLSNETNEQIKRADINAGKSGELTVFYVPMKKKTKKKTKKKSKKKK